jgi:hypothetical protein
VLPVGIAYAGLLTACAGLVSLLKPLRRLHIFTRARGAAVLAVGLLFFFIGAAWPAPLSQVVARGSGLDDFMPAYQFGEFHSIHVHAPPRVAYRAIRDVTADEIFLFRTLTWIRNPHLPGHGQEDILNAPGKKPILEVAMRSGFRLLREEPDSEIVLGTVVLSNGVSRIANPDEFRSFRQPGNALATINFVVRDTGGGWCVVRTETRILATDAASRRRFGVYWRMIYPGSWLIRLNWLRAIRRRAEAASASGGYGHGLEGIGEAWRASGICLLA